MMTSNNSYNYHVFLGSKGVFSFSGEYHPVTCALPNSLSVYVRLGLVLGRHPKINLFGLHYCVICCEVETKYGISND